MVEPLPCSWPDAKARPPAPHLASVPATSKSFGGDDPASRYDRWVLDRETEGFDVVRPLAAPACAPDNSPIVVWERT